MISYCIIITMKTLKNTITLDNTKYDLTKIAPLEDQLYFDIETTGLSAKNSIVYLIGCAYYRDDAFHSIQFFAEQYADEELIIYNFFNFAKYFKYLIHYNGNTFDIPFLLEKVKHYDMPFSLDGFEGLDLYRRLLPYKNFLNLSNLKQVSIEKFIGFERDDSYNGGELISMYHDYVYKPTTFKCELILQHNYDDLRGLLNIMPMLAFTDLFNQKVTISKISKNPYKSFDNEMKAEVVFSLDLPTPIPVDFRTGYSDCYLKANGDKAKLAVTLFEGELKYFYPNYKDYYYLPNEDMSIHKSVASFVDKASRVNAKASNCYTKRIGSFLPQFISVVKPEFKADFHDKTSYFEYTKEVKEDVELMQKYVSSILTALASV